MYKLMLTLLMLITVRLTAQLTPYEKGNKNTTATYEEIISFYKQLDKQSSLVTMNEAGPSDAGFPLHIVYVSATPNETFTASKRKKNKTLIFINNGIHPGEPDGIDASMMLVRDIVQKKINLPSNVLLAIIPVYNIGGCLNRSSNYRVDQNGPEEFGFRGNSQNLDLNRDFIKNDSKEAKSFATIFQTLQPQILIDNHVSNGADYQHVMTLLTTEYNKLGGVMGQYIHQTMEPAIYQLMQQKGYDLVPYVNHFGDTPEKGWQSFFDSPRYSSGYAALWHCFAFVPETHMLKPYWQRVDATFKLMECFIDYAGKNGQQINDLQVKQLQQYNQQKEVSIDWIMNDTIFEEIQFKGYQSEKKESLVSGQPRLFYDRTKPYNKKVPFYNHYKSNKQVMKPAAYIIPQGWWKVIDVLKAHQITMRTFTKDTSIEVSYYTIKDYKSSSTPYENHHYNANVIVESKKQKMQFRKGDVFITTAQRGGRFLVEVLEPHAMDSYFSWNYFDGILGRKEGFSAYVFEETALQLLKNNPVLKEQLEQKKATDEKFKNNGNAQLEFIYKNSKYFETAYMQYPVYRVEEQSVK